MEAGQRAPIVCPGCGSQLAATGWEVLWRVSLLIFSAPAAAYLLGLRGVHYAVGVAVLYLPAYVFVAGALPLLVPIALVDYHKPGPRLLPCPRCRTKVRIGRGVVICPGCGARLQRRPFRPNPVLWMIAFVLPSVLLHGAHVAETWGLEYLGCCIWAGIRGQTLEVQTAAGDAGFVTLSLGENESTAPAVLRGSAPAPKVTAAPPLTSLGPRCPACNTQLGGPYQRKCAACGSTIEQHHDYRGLVLLGGFFAAAVVTGALGLSGWPQVFATGIIGSSLGVVLHLTLTRHRPPEQRLRIKR